MALFLALAGELCAESEAPKPLTHSSFLTESVLIEIPDRAILETYELPFESLNAKQKWNIRIHGLRLAALHPAIWSSLKRERTLNRTLVPIKRYFLRASEDPEFELKQADLRFRFKAVKPEYMQRMRHQKDPVFEIGFGGVFEEQSRLDAPLQDRNYALRLSAFPDIDSGLIERNQEQIQYLQKPAELLLGTGEWYDVQLRFERDTVQITVNGREYLSYNAADIARGMLSLQTSWHPIVLEHLLVEERRRDSAEPRKFSGLLSLKKLENDV